MFVTGASECQMISPGQNIDSQARLNPEAGKGLDTAFIYISLFLALYTLYHNQTAECQETSE